MTESTSIHIEDGKYILFGRGGYDGFGRWEFDTIEEALDYERGLWITDTK